MPRVLAKVVEVRIQAPAKFTVLKAFMSRGSVLVSIFLDNSLPLERNELTGKADHPVLFANLTNVILIMPLSMIPCVRLFFCDRRKFGIQLRAFFLIFFDGLASVRPKCVLIERINMNWRAYVMNGPEI